MTRGWEWRRPALALLVLALMLAALGGTPPPAAHAAGGGALVLYDTTGPYGWLGELYATEVANLASHFGGWTAEPVGRYTAGQLGGYTAAIYVGSTYDEPLPAAFLDDVLAGGTPVVWLYDNIWQLTNRSASFARDYGWMWSQFDAATVNTVRYKGVDLTRDGARNGGGIMRYASVDPAKVTVLADAVRADGSTFPWALRSRNLTYIGENPFVYTSDTDRVLAFEDLLFDALAPATPERHRALVRLEDINPTNDPAELRAVADYLSGQGIRFGFGVSPVYKDPTGVFNDGIPQTIHMWQRPKLAAAIRYLISKGGVMVEHGYTHQYGSVPNPYNAVTGDDFEFYRVTENTDHTLTYVGPVAEDSRAWASARVTDSNQEFTLAGLPIPTVFEFPHYSASAADYAAIGQGFATRWERSLYFGGVLSGGTVDHSHVAGQFFPYVVRDVYGAKVLPENLGSIEPEPFYIFPTRLPAQLIDAARRNLVVRDGFASFYFHPFFSLDYLKQTVEGIRAAGYTFADPASL